MLAVSVFVADGAAAKELRLVVEEWTAARLLRPTLWLDASEDGPADEARTAVVAPSGCHEMRLLDALATHPFTAIRVVTVRMPGGVSTGVVDDRADAVIDVVRRSLAPGQRCELVNVIVPTSTSTLLPPDAFASLARRGARSVVHVLVSPEDRRTERHTSRGVSDGGVPAHAAAALAGVTGSWVLMPTAPFDGCDPVGSVDQPQIVPVRTFARLIEAPDLVDRATDDLLQLQEAVGWMARATDAVPASNPDHLIDGFVSQLAGQQPALRCEAFTPTRYHKDQAITRWAALKMMLRFILDRTRELPRLVLGRIRSLAERTADDMTQRITFGEESWMRVTRRAAARLQDGADAAQPEADAAAELLAALGRNVTPRATAQLWRTLRAVSFASLDAGAFPDGVTAPTDGSRRLVLPHPTDVVAPPGVAPFVVALDGNTPYTSLPAWANAPVGTSDPGGVRRLRELLVRRRDAAVTGIRDQPAAGAEGRGTRDGPTGNDAAPSGDESAGAAEAASIAAVPPDPEAAERLTDAITQLDRFVDRHGGALWWKLGVQVDREEQQAGRRFRDAVQAVVASIAGADKDRIRRLQWRLLVHWSAAVVVAALVAGGAWWMDRVGWVLTRWWIVGVAALVIVGAWWFAAFIPYQRELFRIKYRLDRRHEQHLNAQAAVRHFASEVVMLRSTYTQLLEWADVVARVIHRPATPPGGEDELAEPSDLTVPAAVQVGIGEPDEQARQRVSAMVTRRMFGRGWLTSLYVELRDEAMRTLKLRQGLDASASDPDPDSELAGRDPRTFLRDRLASDGHAADWYETLQTRVDEALRELPSDELFAHVRFSQRTEDELVLGASRAPTTAAAFIGEIIPRYDQQRLSPWVWAPVARFDEAEQITRVHLWSTDGTLTVDAPVAVEVAVSSSSGDPAGPYWAQCVRLDIGRPCSVDELAMAEVDGVEAGGTETRTEVGDGDVW